MAATWGIPGQFDIQGSTDAVIRINVDPVTGTDLGPPDAIEVLGDGTLQVVCEGDETAGPSGAPVVRPLPDLLSGQALNDLSVVWIQKAGTTVQGVLVRWKGGVQP